MQVRCKFDEVVPISQLKPHPKNRNKHPKAQLERLAKILEYQGWRQPVRVSRLKGGEETVQGYSAQSVLEFGRVYHHHEEYEGHPTQKPTELIGYLFESLSKQGCTVVDLFLGSGSTLIACEKTARKCYGMEIDPLYCGVILDRWAKFTGKDPVREDGTPWSKLKNG